MEKHVLDVVVRRIKQRAVENGWRWNEPSLSVDPDGPTYCWFGNGPQGSEPARLLLCMDEHNVPAISVVSSHEIGDFNRDYAGTYLRYLEINQWAPRSST